MNKATPIDTAIIGWRMWCKNPHGDWRDNAQRRTRQRASHMMYVMAEYADLAIGEVLCGKRSDLRLDVERARLREALQVYGGTKAVRVGVNVLNQIASHV